MKLRSLMIAVIAFILVGTARGDDDPEAERKLLELAPGFDVQLVASEPTIINPVQMMFDARGRLWVLCLPRYPQLLPGQDPRDYLVVLDNLAAGAKGVKATVFADKLMIPTGFAVGDGGAYIGQADKLLHYKDKDGDGKSDESRVLLTGFGTQDTHHTLNSFCWGPDGNIYFNQGIYIKSTVETPHGPRKLFGGAVWQLRPDRLGLEVYDRSLLDTNTWGHVFDRWGQSFSTTAWPDGIHLILPDTPLNKSQAKEFVPPLALTRVGGARHCGVELVGGRHLPDDWQTNLISGDFKSQRVQRFTITDDAKKFTTPQLAPLIVSKHPKFRPVDIKQGPDGAIFVADWYDEIIQHNQVDFRDPRRDHSRGRIWRITAKGRPLTPVPRLVDAKIGELLDHLKSPEPWTRLQAKLVLRERDPQLAAAGLIEWMRQLQPGDPDYAHHLLEALWCCQAIDVMETSLLERVARLEEPRARAAAARVAGAWHQKLDAPLRLLGTLAADSNPRVRLEAVLAAMRVPDARALEASLRALEQPSEPLVDFALRKAALVLKPYWYPEFQAGRLTFGGRTRELAFALQAIQAPDAVAPLAKLFADGAVPPGQRADVLGILAALGNADHQASALAEALAPGKLKVAERVKVLEALAEAARSRKMAPKADLGRIATLFQEKDIPVAEASVRLAGAWKLESAREDLQRLAEDKTPALRRAALEALVDLGGPASVKHLANLAVSAKAYGVRTDAVAALASLDTAAAASLAVPLLQKPLETNDDPGPLFLAFAGRTGGEALLAKALKQQAPGADAAKIGLRAILNAGAQAPALAEVLRGATGAALHERRLLPDEMARLIRLVKEDGDPHRGESVFRRQTLGCLQCHGIGGGPKVGPDLAGLGGSAQLDYLLESIILPGKVIREGYTTAHIVTQSGKSLSGILLRDTPQEIVLRDPTRDEIVIPARDIDEKRTGGSLMPSGLIEFLTDRELTDLVRFLSELGKPGPFAPSHAPVARRWQVLTQLPAELTNLKDDLLGLGLFKGRGLQFTSLPSKVSGHLPLAEIAGARAGGFVFARTHIDVTKPGKLEMLVEAPAGTTFWVDGFPIEPAQRLAFDLDAGAHILDFRVPVGETRSGLLRVELAESSAKQARFAEK